LVEYASISQELDDASEQTSIARNERRSNCKDKEDKEKAKEKATAARGPSHFKRFNRAMRR